MSIHCKETAFEGLFVLEPQIFRDQRGFFKESYNANSLKEIAITDTFVQDNVSYSIKNTLRGMHFQKPPFAQAKLVTVLSGSVVDVVIDIRKNSPTYGKHYAIQLSEQNHLQLYIPVGFAHGFIVQSETCLFLYKCSNFYSRTSEGGLMWNDPAFDIFWSSKVPLLSDKDLDYPPFAQFISPF